MEFLTLVSNDGYVHDIKTAPHGDGWWWRSARGGPRMTEGLGLAGKTAIVTGAGEVTTAAARSGLLKGVLLKRHSTPEDLAVAVLVFAGERLSCQLTGQMLSVSGGRQMPC